MLEKLTDERDWESLIQSSIPDIRFIADLPFNEEDWKRIEQYVMKALLMKSNARLERIMDQTPCVLACYLVLRGIYMTQSGNYWPGISVSAQNILKQFFVQFLIDQGLETVNIPDSNFYVTSILYQGYFPRSLISDLFDLVILPLTKDLVYPESQYELRHWLEGHRSQLHRDEESIRPVDVKDSSKSSVEKSQSLVDFSSLPESECRRISDLWKEIQVADSEVCRYQDIILEKEDELRRFSSVGIDNDQKLIIEEFRCHIYRAILAHSRKAWIIKSLPRSRQGAVAQHPTLIPMEPALYPVPKYVMFRLSSLQNQVLTEDSGK